MLFILKIKISVNICKYHLHGGSNFKYIYQVFLDCLFYDPTNNFEQDILLLYYSRLKSPLGLLSILVHLDFFTE